MMGNRVELTPQRRHAAMGWPLCLSPITEQSYGIGAERTLEITLYKSFLIPLRPRGGRGHLPKASQRGRGATRSIRADVDVCLLSGVRRQSLLTLKPSAPLLGEHVSGCKGLDVPHFV